MSAIRILIFSILFFGCNSTYEIELAEGPQKDLILAAIARTNMDITYDGRYVKIPYPNGDIPNNIGVCTDLLIRGYRKIGIDLQKLVHEDMTENFKEYPSSEIWGAKGPDSNIDHRRVPNLEKFFSRKNAELVITKNSKDYLPGDIVTWNIPGSSPWHIGIVSNRLSTMTNTPLIIHNFGKGPVITNILFKYEIRGHYRYVNS